jgi:hypothetical protein
MSYVNCASSIINGTLILPGNVLPGEAACKAVTVKGNCLIIKSDCKDISNNVLNTIFRAGSARSISDYIIISDKVILVCEMKSNNEGKMKVQLKNTAKFVNYLIGLMKLHCQHNIATPPIKFVCFTNSNPVKQTTNGGKLVPIAWNGSELFRLGCNSFYSLSQFI